MGLNKKYLKRWAKITSLKKKMTMYKMGSTVNVRQRKEAKDLQTHYLKRQQHYEPVLVRGQRLTNPVF
jgi:hypothetical protein